MSPEEITRMAHEAGLHLATEVKWMPIIGFEYAEKLIRLAQAAEREACAKVCDTYEEWCGPWGQDDNLYAATESAKEIATAIRARGQA